MHGGALLIGSLTRPVVVSQWGPKSMFLPCALAWSNVNGRLLAPVVVLPVATCALFLLLLLFIPAIATIAPMTTTTATMGPYRLSALLVPLLLPPFGGASLMS